MFDANDIGLQKSAHQRADGATRIAFHRDRQGKTRLADLFQRAPCRVLFPDIEPDEPVQAVLLTTSGGLTGGDRLKVEVDVGPGARVTLTSQAAEKIYRALPGEPETKIGIGMTVGEGAWAEWLAQETILFDRARLRRLLVADLHPTGRLLAVESLVFGRAAMGERFDSGFIHDAWRIRRNGRLVWADALHLEGDIAAQRAAPFGFGQARACATIVYVGEDAGLHLSVLREQLHDMADIGAATAFDGLLIVRLLADDAPFLRLAVARIAGTIRHLVAGLSEKLPRVWEC